MLKLRNVGVILLFVLPLSLRFFAIPADSGSRSETNIFGTKANKSNPFSEIYDSYPHCYNAIEIRSFSQNITEVYRFLAILILPNQIVPINSNIWGTIFIPTTFNFNSPVPIFILGHALLC